MTMAEKALLSDSSTTSRIGHRFRLALVLLVSCFSLTLARAGSARADVTYIYDTAGRLNYVIDDVGNVTQYTYDSDGNITQVNTMPQATGVVIYSLEPNNGIQGTSVTIYGTGFGGPGQGNTVSFNGVAATVTNSTGNAITTSVPSGATTGPVSVTSPYGSATGPTFTVQ
jgi:YD repeat-containing protein